MSDIPCENLDDIDAKFSQTVGRSTNLLNEMKLDSSLYEQTESHTLRGSDSYLSDFNSMCIISSI